MLRRPAAAVRRRPAAASVAPVPEQADINALSDTARTAALSAVADEAWSELVALDTGTRRKHIHWTHVRTHDETHKQPDQFTE